MTQLHTWTNCERAGVLAVKSCVRALSVLCVCVCSRAWYCDCENKEPWIKKKDIHVLEILRSYLTYLPVLSKIERNKKKEREKSKRCINKLLSSRFVTQATLDMEVLVTNYKESVEDMAVFDHPYNCRLTHKPLPYPWKIPAKSSLTANENVTIASWYIEGTVTSSHNHH